MAQAPIEAHGLSKVYASRFGSRRIAALDGLDLRVEAGQVFGLLGPNGAGKTTTVKILLGLTRPTTGQASLLRPARRGPGEPPPRRATCRKGTGSPGYLTARQTLSIFGRMSGVESAATPRARAPSSSSACGLSRVGGRPGQEVLEGHDAAPRPRRGADPRSATSCSSTSRPTASIRSAAARSATSSRRRRRAARRSSSTRTCSRRSSAPATASPCCARAGSRSPGASRT